MAVRFSADGQDYTRTLSMGAIASVSVACWWKISVDRNTWSSPWFIDAGTGDNIGIQTSNDGVTMGVVDGGSTLQNMGAAVVGVWYYTLLTMSAGSGTLYWRTAASTNLNAVAITGGTPDVTATTLRIGESPWGTEWLNGPVGPFKFWAGVVMSAAEAQAESWQVQPVRSNGLAGFYTFQRHDGVMLDYSGNGRTLTGTGATYEDDPPVPWQRTPIRLYLQSTASGTTATAEAATASATAHDTTSTVATTAAEASGAAVAEQPTAITTVVATAEAASGSAVAHDAAAAVATQSEAAAASAVGNDAASAVVVTAEVAGASGLARDATVATGSFTTASAEAATATVTANDSAALISVSAGESAATGTAETPAASVATGSLAASASGTAETSSLSVAVNAGEATGVGQAHDATVATAGGSNATAQEAAATAAAQDATVSVVTGASVATAVGQADDATGVVVVLAQAQPALGAAVAHDPGMTIVLIVGEAAATAAALDPFIPPQVSRGQMSAVDRTRPTMTAGTGTAPGMTPVARAGSSMKGV